MKSFLVLALALSALNAQAAFPVAEEVRDELNQSPYGQHVQLGTQLQSKKVHLLRAQYDAETMGGAVGQIQLRDVDGKPAVIPAGAIVKDCLIHVLDPPLSTGSAVIGFGTGARADDLKAVNTGKAAYANSDALIACTPVGSAATAIKMPGFTDQYSGVYGQYTREYTPTISIGTAALYRGRINVLIELILNR